MTKNKTTVKCHCTEVVSTCIRLPLTFYLSIKPGTVASSKSAGGTRLPREEGTGSKCQRRENRDAEVGGALGLVSPSPTDLKLLEEHSELPQWGRGWSNVFLAYLKPTEQPIQSSVSHKRPLN